MTKSIIKLGLLGLLSAAIATVPSGVQAKDTNAPALEKKAVKESKSKTARLPFHGKLKAVDQTAKTISVGQRTFQITAETIITKGDKPATLGDGVIGEAVSGSAIKGEDGKLTVGKLHFGPKPKAAKKATGSKPEMEMTK